MQGFSNSLHRLALCEKGVASLSPPAGLSHGTVCISLSVAQKTHARPVGGRGISVFQLFFCWGIHFQTLVVIVLINYDLVGIVTTMPQGKEVM